MPREHRRRLVAALAASCAWPGEILAQSITRSPSIGLLMGTPRASQEQMEAFVDGMRGQGFVEGKNIRYERRYDDAVPQRMEQNARELAAAKVALIWTNNTPRTLAAKKATSSIPVLFALAGDPVGSGLVRSLAAPGGNATGYSLQNPELRAKRIEILHDIAPSLTRIGVLHDPRQSAVMRTALADTEKGAKALGKEMFVVEVAAADRIDEAFSKLESWKAQAVVILEASLLLANRQALHERAAKSRLPTITGSAEYAEAGSLVSYGADYVDICRRSAAYAARILKGAKPGELPVQQPTKFELVINLKTAKTLGISVPPQFLLRADRVIE